MLNWVYISVFWEISFSYSYERDLWFGYSCTTILCLSSNKVFVVLSIINALVISNYVLMLDAYCVSLAKVNSTHSFYWIQRELFHTQVALYVMKYSGGKKNPKHILTASKTDGHHSVICLQGKLLLQVAVPKALGLYCWATYRWPLESNTSRIHLKILNNLEQMKFWSTSENEEKILNTLIERHLCHCIKQYESIIDCKVLLGVIFFNVWTI